jgi:hypothetical protein
MYSADKSFLYVLINKQEIYERTFILVDPLCFENAQGIDRKLLPQIKKYIYIESGTAFKL